MGDIKLFKFSNEGTFEIVPTLAQMERNLQNLVEKHLECFLGIKLLAHEYRTSRPHRGCIDSLGIDENQCPVIIEYKRFNNENIICQGLFYLDWLLTHKADFLQLLRARLGKENAHAEFGGARVICIASAYSRYDEQAIMQIDRNIELIRYRFFEDNLLMLEMLNTSLQMFVSDSNETKEKDENVSIGMPAQLQERIRNMNNEIEELYLEAIAFAENLGDDVSIKFMKHYIALVRLKNFTCIQPMKTFLKLWVNIDPASISLEDGFSRDVTSIGHLASGNVELEVKDAKSWQKAQQLIELAYQQN